MQCPKCKFGPVSRTKREGFWEQKLYPLLGFYPWECTSCRRRLLLKARYKRPAKRQGTQPA
jgi:DNA-directed RNA polymerase subunit RPC12/RpoP